MNQCGATPEAGQGPRLSRRRFLQAAGAGAVVLCGTGYGVFRWIEGGGGPPAPRYLSQPDLDPPGSSVIVPAAGTAPGYVFVSPWNPAGQRGPLILDNAARPVWFRNVSHSASNFAVQSYQGRPVLAWWEGEVLLPAGIGKGDYVLLDSSYQEVTRVRAGNGLSGDLHDFVITREDTALLTAYREEPADLSSIGGPQRGRLLNSYLQEVDIASGRVLLQWNAARHVGLDESYLAPPTDGQAYDFLHINSIDVDTDGNLIVSGRHTWAVYKIDRQSGRVIWRLNGKLSDFAMGPNARFAWQHHARHHPGSTLSVFDDGGGPTNVATRSRGLLLALDLQAKRARMLHQYFPDPSFLTTSQGSVQVLEGGNVFVGWGAKPYFSEYTADAALLFDGHLPHLGSYRAFRFPWTGRPNYPPAVAVHRSGQALTAYASWNGATEVTAWAMLVGSSPQALHRVGSADRDGFETTIHASSHERQVAVEALDSAGRVLGRSRVIEV